MKIDCVVCWSHSGVVTVKSESAEIKVQLDESQRNRILEVAREAFLEHQRKLIEEVKEIPPSYLLPAPEEIVEAEFTSVHDDLQF